MNVLLICHSLPSPYTTNAIALRVFYLVKWLSQKYQYNFTIISFSTKSDSEQCIKEYCDDIFKFELPIKTNKRYLYYIANYLYSMMHGDLTFNKKNILDYNFSHEMQKRINKLVETNHFDIIFIDDFSMVSYASNLNSPKILTEIGNIPEIHYNAYKIETNIFKKASRILLYLIAKNHEKLYQKFDVTVVTTTEVKNILESHISGLDIRIIPFGVDIHSKFQKIDGEFPSLIITGTMASIFNQRSVLYFYHEIFPLIKEKISDIKLYIVGKDPSKEIRDLEKDDSVIVTGYVEDVKPYLSRSSIVVLPIHGFGIKTRLLEAMAMGKPIVISPEGTRGVDVTHGQNIIIADNPTDFAYRVVELLNDDYLRETIGLNARKLMEEKYSWEKIADMLNEICVEIIKVRG